MKERAAVFLVIFAGMLWGTTGTAQTFAPDGTHPIVLGAVRLAIGGLTLLMVVLLQGKLNIKNWSSVSIVLAAFSMAAFQPLFFTAVHVTGVAIGTVVAIGSAPILSGILEWVVWRRAPQRKWYVATFLAILGCLLLVTNQQEVNIDMLGVLMAVGAGLAFAVYTLVSKQLVKDQRSDAVVAVVFTLSAIFLSPVLFIYDLSWFLELRGVGVALHLGVMATAVAYLLFARGLQALPAATAVTLALAEPLTAALLGVFIVGEELSITAWVGVCSLFLGLAVLSYTRKKISSPVDVA